MKRLHALHFAVLGRLLRIALLAIAAAGLLTGCASFYVDNATKEVPIEQFKRPAAPQPVQLLFEFQTKGTLNAKATEMLKPQVVDQVKVSGLFSAVQETPVNGSAILSITLNNVPITDDAYAKGFATGLTFGLVGSQVTDGYVCTLKYQTSAQPQPITVSARHALHTVLGTGSAPANSVKAETAESGVRTITRQVISTTLNDLSQNPAFR